jgi:hypothetical protein
MNTKQIRLLVAILLGLLVIYVFVFSNRPEPLAPPEKPFTPEDEQQSEFSNTKKNRDVDSFGCPYGVEYEFDEIIKHIKCSIREPEKNDLWLLIDGRVYNVTDWSK